MNDLFTTTDSASEPPAYRWSGRRLVPTAEPGGLAQLDETPPKRHARLVVEHGFRGCGNESGPVRSEVESGDLLTRSGEQRAQVVEPDPVPEPGVKRIGEVERRLDESGKGTDSLLELDCVGQVGRYLHCPDGSHLAMYDDQQRYFTGLVEFLHGLTD